MELLKLCPAYCLPMPSQIQYKTNINQLIKFKKMKKSQFLVFGILAISVVVFGSCNKNDDPKSKTSGFTTPDEFVQNPSVKDAINESGIEINEGTNPPALAGNYLTNGKVIDASDLLSDEIGSTINTEFDLYNQTTSGKISFQEKVGEISVSGIGGYITGENGKFTIYGESMQSGSEAGLPDDLSMNVVLLMSGTKLSNGNLSPMKGISIITEVNTSNKSYGDVKTLEGNWWMWNADFTLQTGLKSSTLRLDNGKINHTMQEIMKNVFEKVIKSE